MVRAILRFIAQPYSSDCTLFDLRLNTASDASWRRSVRAAGEEAVLSRQTLERVRFLRSVARRKMREGEAR